MSNDIPQNEVLAQVPSTDLEEEIMDVELKEPVVVETPVKEEPVVPEQTDSKPYTGASYKYTNANVTMTVNPRKPMPTEKPDNREPLGILSLTGSEVAEFGNQQSFQSVADSLGEQYMNALRAGVQLSYNDDTLDSVVDNGGEFVQSVKYEDKTLHAIVPKYSAGNGDTLTGIKAVSQIQRALGIGSFLNFPCWASGVWLTLRAPTTFELADYYDALAEEVIELGTKTNGAIYGNSSVYIAKHLIDLAEKLVYDCSIKDFTDGKHKLRDILVVDELQTIAWALAVCMYPNGYPFEEPCTVNIEKCSKVYTTLLNISKMHWVDKKRLTNFQIQFMSNKTIKRSMDEIRKYQSEATWLQSKSIGYNGFEILIKTPTIGEHVDAGYRWIDDIEQSIRNALGNISDTKLNNLILERAGLTLLRSYSHYVKAFIYADGSVVNSKPDIDATIDNLCTQSELVTRFTNDINEHIASSTISMIAIPRFRCSGCQKDPNENEQTHPHLIPIDGVQLFFALRDQKLQLV